MRNRYHGSSLLAALCFLFVTSRAPSQQKSNYFKILVTDQQTGRGVPLVELRTVHNIRYITDSQGMVAFDEPGLMHQKVFFYVQSHGYEYPKDSLGMRGIALIAKPGGSAHIVIKRVNIAERLYRTTGGGIYRDSVLLGEKPPLKVPLLNAQMLGQDSVHAVPYHNKIYWFWGDTNRPSYPLGNFATSGATSLPPGHGGLDPSTGVDLTYFVNTEGFCRAMAPLPDPGPVWVDGVMTVRDASGQERLLAAYARMRSLSEPLERGIMRLNDKTQTLERIARFPLEGPLFPQGHPFHHSDHGVEYVYFPTPYPNIRVRASYPAVLAPTAYEAYTPLASGTRFQGTASKIERDAAGKPVWGWKRYTAPLSPAQQKELVTAGKLPADSSPFALQDANTGQSVMAHAGSVCWNAYRKRWIMIFVQAGGTSFLGEVWYTEAEKPEGPWRNAVKIVSHDRYDFYNPTQHPFFDQQGGRIIYFEGTYSNTFTGNPETPATPRYDYNEIMYRLDLSEPRLHGKTP